MLAPEFLTAEGLPHALRAIGTLPVVYIFAALFFDRLIASTDGKQPIFRSTMLFLITIALVFIGTFNIVKYHVFWAQKKEAAIAFNKNLLDTAYYLQTLGPHTEKYVIAGPLERLSVAMFNTKTPRVTYLYPDQIDLIAPQGKDFVVLLGHRDALLTAQLQKRFPALTETEVRNGPGSVFFVLSSP